MISPVTYKTSMSYVEILVSLVIVGTKIKCHTEWGPPFKSMKVISGIEKKKEKDS